MLPYRWQDSRKLYVMYGGRSHLIDSHSYLLIITSPMNARYLWLDSTKNFATFLVGAFRKVYLPINEVRYLTDAELNNYLTDATQGFNTKPVTLC